MLIVGDWCIQSVVNGYFRLDGGAMFGVVPKVLWAPSQQVDELNRILLATRTLLAIHRPTGRIVLTDTGAGGKWTADKAQRYGVEPILGAIEAALAALGATPADVTDVIVTHLHFDHAGGMTTWADAAGGATRLCYPNARHWIHRGHWDHAHRPTPRDRASFFPVDFAILESAGVLQFVEGDAPAADLPWLRWRVSNGHTPYQLLPQFQSGGGTGDVLFIGDMVPTAAHLPPAWIMAYDLYPVTTLAEREEVYARCRADDMRLAFPHDPEKGIVMLRWNERGHPQVAQTLG